MSTTLDDNPGIRALGQFLIDADEVARRTGSEYGLPDCVDMFGRPYQSAGLASWLDELRKLGIKPILSLADAEASGR